MVPARNFQVILFNLIFPKVSSIQYLKYILYIAVLFEEPVQVVAGKWYVAWARVSGPSSDCGSSGQGQVITEDDTLLEQGRQSISNQSRQNKKLTQKPKLLKSLHF